MLNCIKDWLGQSKTLNCFTIFLFVLSTVCFEAAGNVNDPCNSVSHQWIYSIAGQIVVVAMPNACAIALINFSFFFSKKG